MDERDVALLFRPGALFTPEGTLHCQVISLTLAVLIFGSRCRSRVRFSPHGVGRRAPPVHSRQSTDCRRRGLKNTDNRKSLGKNNRICLIQYNRRASTSS